MKVYNRVSVALSTAAVLFWLWCMWQLRPTFRIEAAHDGSGGDPTLLIVGLLLIVLAIVLVHSTMVSRKTVFNEASRTVEAVWISRFHVGLWLAAAAGFVLPVIAGSYERYTQEHSARARAYRASDAGSIDDFDKYYPLALKELSSDWTRWNFKNSVQYDAEVHARLSIMKRLQDKWDPSLYTKGEYAWSGGLQSVLGSSASSSQDKLQVVKWFMDEGKPLGFSLRSDSAKFSASTMFMTAYSQLDDPATQQLVELLVENGVNLTECTGAYQCPLLDRAGVGDLVAVRYLLAHGAPVNQSRPGDGATALSVAVERSIPNMVKLLLDAGAQPTFGAASNDIVAACDVTRRRNRDSPFDGEKVLQNLRDAHVRMSAQELARYDQPLRDPGQAECVKTFM